MSQCSLDTRPYCTAALDTQVLPFQVSLATTAEDFTAALEMRARAFARHGMFDAEKLRAPEPEDGYDDVLVLIARQKLDRRVIGTIRLQPNFARPLRLEEVLCLSPEARRQRSAELMRLGVENGTAGRMVTAALAKAVFEICRRCRIDHIFVGGRRPVDAIYRSYQFSDLLNGKAVELSWTKPGLLHHVLHMPIAEAEQRWKCGNPALYDFMVLTDHPDIAIDHAEAQRRLGPRS